MFKIYVITYKFIRITKFKLQNVIPSVMIVIQAMQQNTSSQ